MTQWPVRVADMDLVPTKNQPSLELKFSYCSCRDSILKPCINLPPSKPIELYPRGAFFFFFSYIGLQGTQNHHLHNWELVKFYSVMNKITWISIINKVKRSYMLAWVPLDHLLWLMSWSQQNQGSDDLGGIE